MDNIGNMKNMESMESMESMEEMFDMKNMKNVENTEKMTSARLAEEIKTLSGYFDCVRVLKAEDVPIPGMSLIAPGSECRCSVIWGRKEPCSYCISSRTLADKVTRSKLEIVGDSVYQAMSKYAEVDGEPCIIEMIRKLDDEFVNEYSRSDSPISGFYDYYEKIYIDVLTGCNNRRFYEERLKDTTVNAGVAFIDIDDFKLYNDVYGHAAGDDILRAIGSCIRRCIRPDDSLVRYGGDEFIAILPGAERGELLDILDSIRENVAAVKLEGLSAVTLSLSIGAVMSDNETINEAVNRADALLMYKAKKEKNKVITDENVIGTPSHEKANVLIVDDSDFNREILISILGNEFSAIEAGSGEECIKCLELYGKHISIVLLDVVMPGMSGFEVLSYMNVHHIIDDIPVIMITGDESDGSIRKAYELGVSDYINRPFDVKVVYRRVMNTIQLYSKQRRLIKRVTEQTVEKENDARIMTGIISHIAEFRNGDSGKHIINIRRLVRMTLERLVLKTDRYPLSMRDIDMITNASALHDIGKMTIDENILNKPGRLTAEEFEKIKTHTTAGAEMIWSLREYRDEPLLKYARDICLYHHERYDGSGYPYGLRGDEIPIAAQVVAICDVYDALVSPRVYKAAIPHEQAMKIIEEDEREKYSPVILECFREMSDELSKISTPKN